MRSLLISALLLFCLAAPAQEKSLGLIQQAFASFEKGEYRNVIPVALQAVETTKTELGENSPLHSGMVLFLAMSYWNLFQYTDAETWFIKHADLILKHTGEKTLDYIGSLNRLAQLHREMGKYNEAETSYIKALAVAKTMFGTDDTVYAKSLNNLAALYQHIGQYSKAEQQFIQSRDILKKVAGEKSGLYASSLNNLATLYSDMGQVSKTKPLMLQVLAIRKAVYGELHPDYAQGLNNLGYTEAFMGQYKDAELHYTQAKDIYAKTLGDQHPDYASSLSNLGQLYSEMGEYDKAEQLYIQSRDIRKKTVGENHPDYALSLNNLAGLYEGAGRFELAEQLYIESETRTKQVLGVNHPYYVVALNNLGAHFHTRGDYVKSEYYYHLAKDTRKALLGDKHPSYAMSLNNLGTFYHEMGQFDKAEQLFLQARDIWKNSLGTGHSSYAMCLNNLAAVYEDKLQFSKAEPLYIQARDIRKAVYGVNHSEYAASLNNLAALYGRMGQYSKSEALIVQTNNIWKQILQPTDPLLATGMNNQAAVYRKAQIKSAESEQLYLQAIALRQKVLGVDHPLTAETENDLALLYMNLKQFKKAENLLLSSTAKTTQNLVRTFPVLSEKGKASYINDNLFFNDCNNSYLFNNPAASASIVHNNLNLQLFFKSLSLAETRQILETVRSSGDSSLVRIARDWQTLMTMLAAQYALPVNKRIKNIAEKEEEAENKEKELTRRSAEFRNRQAALQVTLKEVREKMEPGEAAIEFVSFRYYNKRQTDSIMYAAYILRKEDTVVRFVPLFEEKKLQDLINQAGRSATGVAKTFYGVAMNFSSAIADDLYVLLWKPLEKHLQGVKKISYSPSGKLYGIAFHAIPDGAGKILQDKYEMRQYVSTRQIAFRSNNKTSERPGDIALFGNADFSMDSAAIARQLTTGNNEEGVASVSRGGGGGWPDLPFTGVEIDSIQRLFEKHKVSSKVFQKTDANETQLKKLNAYSPRILHIATHGFYVPESIAGSGSVVRPEQNSYKIATDPLMRNGLILAGGNYVWGGKAPVKGAEDGVATAYEIAHMDLSNTDLVVLSACETALGDIKGSEGVFGLQRAFKMAGAKKMILSLWQVPDMETAQLMISFYTNWLGGMGLDEAFYSAQSEMRKKYPPFNWAAFVLIE
jgi:CHAT domain-containing protein